MVHLFSTLSPPITQDFPCPSLNQYPLIFAIDFFPSSLTIGIFRCRLSLLHCQEDGRVPSFLPGRIVTACFPAHRCGERRSRTCRYLAWLEVNHLISRQAGLR